MPYHHFTREDRYIVSHMVLAGFSFREIGRRIGKHHGSISREIKRIRLPHPALSHKGRGNKVTPQQAARNR